MKMLHSHARWRAKIIQYHDQESEPKEGWSCPDLAGIKLSILLETWLFSIPSGLPARPS